MARVLRVDALGRQHRVQPRQRRRGLVVAHGRQQPVREVAELVRLGLDAGGVVLVAQVGTPSSRCTFEGK